MRELPKRITPDELEKLHEKLSAGLREMLDFERDLHRYDKETLCLFLTLMVERENYPEVRSLLDNLDPIGGG